MMLSSGQQSAEDPRMEEFRARLLSLEQKLEEEEKQNRDKERTLAHLKTSHQLAIQEQEMELRRAIQEEAEAAAEEQRRQTEEELERRVALGGGADAEALAKK